MRLFGRNIEHRTKTLVLLVGVFLVSAGLCRLQLNAHATGGLGELIYVFLPLGLLELTAMFVSACWIVILLIAWGAEALYERYGKAPRDQVQRMFDTDDSDPADEG